MIARRLIRRLEIAVRLEAAHGVEVRSVEARLGAAVCRHSGAVPNGEAVTAAVHRRDADPVVLLHEGVDLVVP